MRRIIIVCLALVVLAACSSQAPPDRARRPVTDVVPGRADVGGVTVSLPLRIGEWTRPEVPKRVTAETIFDYMDGAGELYLAYRFDHLDVFEYKPAKAALGTLLVEIYSLQSSDDAFGLLSNDWGGEPAGFGETNASPAGAAPSDRAIYGAGLLRVWSGALFVRVLAAKETAESREAVLALGRQLADAPSQRAPAPPAILSAFTALTGGAGAVRADRTCFFRSHLVLNSQYFLASQDILGLGLDVQAVTTELRPPAKGERAVRVIAVRYPTADRAAAGLRSFLGAYLPGAGARRPTGAAQVEQGWVGWAQKQRDLVLALDGPAAAAASRVASHILAAMPVARPGEE